MDLVDEAEAQAVEARIKALNGSAQVGRRGADLDPPAGWPVCAGASLEGIEPPLGCGWQIVRSTMSKVAIDEVINIRAFELERIMVMDPSFLDDGAEHMHDQTVSSVGITCPGALQLDKLQDWMGDLLRNKGEWPHAVIS
jgi:G3E family GTPase